MPRYFVQLHDSMSNRDAFININLPHITSTYAAWLQAETELAQAKFEVVDVSEVVSVPMEFAQELTFDELPTIERADA